MVLTPADGEGVAVRENHFEATDVIPGGPIAKTAGAGGVAADHAAQRRFQTDRMLSFCFMSSQL